jgi:hypothetical protein
MMIAGAGFAMMAWRLAQHRRWFKDYVGPLERHQLGKTDGPSTEYYRILDRAAASWPAFYGERLCGICPKVGL